MPFQTCLLVEVPPYRNQRLSTPVHVNFYVCNGKRKRSQHQHFTFVPVNGKAVLLFLLLITAAFFLFRPTKVWGKKKFSSILILTVRERGFFF